MKRKLIALGIASPLFFLFACVAVAIVVGLGTWLITDPEGPAKAVRIISVAPLTTPEAASSQSAAVEANAEPLNQPAAETVMQAETAPEDQANAAGNPSEAGDSNTVASADPDGEVEPFMLPAGSVNSITQEGVATRLIVPKLSLDSPVVLSPIENQTWKVDHLGQHNIGHLEGTAPPGADSNIVLAGHVTVSNDVQGPFADLEQLAPGDNIFVYYGEQIYEYEIEAHQTVDRTAVEVTYPSDQGRVTLITCSNWDDQAGRYLERLIVSGRLIKG